MPDSKPYTTNSEIREQYQREAQATLQRLLDKRKRQQAEDLVSEALRQVSSQLSQERLELMRLEILQSLLIQWLANQ